MNARTPFAFLVLLAIPNLASADADSGTSVTIEHAATGDGWQLLRDGNYYDIKGVGGTNHLELAANIGANTIRTWGADQLEQTIDGRPLLDRAHALGLSAVVGLWIAHEQKGFDYGNASQVQQQRDEVRTTVRRYRDHPAVLVWGLGNEMELHAAHGDEPRIWRELETLARIVKEEDPRHPVMTVLAYPTPQKLQAIRDYYPSLDILGLNVYGNAANIPALLDGWGWTGPYMLAEFGPPGNWEVDHTDWKAPIEPTTENKCATYRLSYRATRGDPHGRCIGTFCFYWGQKHEATATWFNMFLATGEKTPLVDTMSFEFTGRRPANQSPLTTDLVAPFANRRVRPGSIEEVSATVVDAENDPLQFEWLIVGESVARSAGDPQEAPPTYPECTVSQSGPHARLRLPERPGAYRLFLTVRDGAGGGCSENVTFLVE